jgi:hypothetical protein
MPVAVILTVEKVLTFVTVDEETARITRPNHCRAGIVTREPTVELHYITGFQFAQFRVFAALLVVRCHAFTSSICQG